MLDLLRALPPTGWNGLEGLVGQRLARHLGLKARQEKSGRQHGRDVGLFEADGRPAGIDIETKRYGDATALRERELLGEIAETVRARPDTRTWILVATTPVSAATAAAIIDEGFRRSLDVVVLDVEPDGLGSLQTLLASAPDETLVWVAAHDPANHDRWRAELAAARAQPSFEVIETALSTTLTGRYAARAARERAQAWLRDRLHADRARRQEFNQRIFRTGKAPPIARPRLEADLAPWRSRQGPGTLLLLGGEGDGKTWTAIDLLAAATDRVPLLVTANLYDDGGPASLLAKALERQCGGDYDAWRNRLEARAGWPDDFRMTVLIDGLNEAPHFRTGEMLDELLNADFAPWLDLIVTCRTPFWEHRVEPAMNYKGDGDHELHTVWVGPFDEHEEWPAAREALGPGAEDLPDAMVEALRNPRLWSFAYHLRARLGGLREITLENLLVEHWRLRRSDRADIGLSDQEFNRLVARSVQHLRAQGDVRDGALDRGQLDRLLREMSGQKDYSQDLAEIEDGVFYQSGYAGSLRLRPERVPVALGLMLADDMLEASLKPDPGPAMMRAAAALLDDLPGNDQVETIIRAAVFALVSLPTGQRRALPTLLRHWVAWQNREDDFDRALSIVAGLAPDAFLVALEDDSQDDEIVGGQIQSDLLRGLLSRRDLAQYGPSVSSRVSTWLGSLPRSRYGGQAAKLGPKLTSLDWVETLDDVAGSLIAPLPQDAWSAPLTAWARRRAWLDEHGANADRYDHHLSWLGLVAPSLDLDQIAQTSPPLEAGAFRALGELLDGGLFAQNSVFHELEADAWPSTEQQAEALADESAFDYDVLENLYGKNQGEVAEGWMRLERVMLDEAPAKLAALVRFLSEKIGDPHVMGLAQLQRDHALLLGAANTSIAVRLVKALESDKRQDRNLAIYAARAVEVAMAFTPSADQGRTLSQIAVSTKLGQLDLSATPPAPDTSLLDLFGELGEALDAKAFALLQLTSRRAAPPQLLASPQFTALVVRAAESSPLWSPMALLTALQADDDALREKVANVCNIVNANGTAAILTLRSELAFKMGDQSYAALRTRVTTDRLARAAERDGTAEAVAAFHVDFETVLFDASSNAWPNPYAERMAIDLPGLRPNSRRRGRVTFPRAQTARAIAVISGATPDYVSDLCARLDTLSPETLLALESRTGLVSTVADLAGERSASWFAALKHDTSRTEFKGLMVSPAMMFAFQHDHTVARRLRDEMAEDAWNDAALADLVCLAALTGRASWLDAWIGREEADPARNRRIRALVLRGWRDWPQDLAALAAPGIDAYEDQARKVARHRCARLKQAREGLAAFFDAADDTMAWLGYRRMAQAVDRRIWVELDARQGAEQGLSAPRATQLRIFKDDLEKHVGRNEGRLEETFAGAAYPKMMSPWDPPPLYGAQRA